MERNPRGTERGLIETGDGTKRRGENGDGFYGFTQGCSEEGRTNQRLTAGGLWIWVFFFKNQRSFGLGKEKGSRLRTLGLIQERGRSKRGRKEKKLIWGKRNLDSQFTKMGISCSLPLSICFLFVLGMWSICEKIEWNWWSYFSLTPVSWIPSCPCYGMSFCKWMEMNW